MKTTSDFDSAVMARVRQMGGPDLVRRLVELVLAQAPLRVADIRAGAAAGDLGTVAFAAHALRSTAGNVGAVRVLDLATRLEAGGKAGQADAVAGLANELDEAWDAMRDYLDGVVKEES